MNPPSILEMLSFYTRDRFRVTRGGFILDVDSKDRGLEISTISSPFKDLVLSSKLRIKGIPIADSKASCSNKSRDEHSGRRLLPNEVPCLQRQTSQDEYSASYD